MQSLSTGNGVAKRAGILQQPLTYLLACAVIYVFACSEAMPTFVDEASSFYLASDKSLSHVFAAIRAGADGSFPVYAILLHGWEKLFGASELSLRLNSGIFVLLFVWHSGKRLGRCFGPWAATLSLLFVLTNKLFGFGVLEARFYGLVIFLFSLCYWSSWDLLEQETISKRQSLWHALVCGLLCLSHPLGLVYVGILGGSHLLLSAIVKRWSLRGSLSFLGGPLMFLLWLPSFLHQRLINPTYVAAPPGWRKYWSFAFFDSVLLVVILLGGIAAGCALKALAKTDPNKAKSSNLEQGPWRKLLVIHSVLFIVSLNVAMAVLDASHMVPVYWMPANRYVLVCWTCYATVNAAVVAGFARLLRIFPRPRLGLEKPAYLLAFAGLLALMASNWGEWLRGRASDTAFFSKVSKIAKEQRLNVVCANYWDAFYLKTRTPTTNVCYLLEDNYPFKRYLFQITKYYPAPVSVSASRPPHFTNDFLFLTLSPREIHMMSGKGS